IFITHDLAAARYVSDRIAIMYAGRLVEMGPAGEVLGEPRHPYTMLLRDAVPDPTQSNVARIQAEERGEPPDLTALPVGCAFAPRCAFAREECLVAFPSWRRASEGHEVRCVLLDEATP
ncbi:MAG: ABC transporter ATP-binding protein, partial [Acidimicrobiales bacterium]